MFLSVSLLLVEAYITLFFPCVYLSSGCKTLHLGHCFLSDIFTYMFIGGFPLDRFGGIRLYVASFVFYVYLHPMHLTLMVFQEGAFGCFPCLAFHPTLIQLFSHVSTLS